MNNIDSFERLPTQSGRRGTGRTGAMWMYGCLMLSAMLGSMEQSMAQELSPEPIPFARDSMVAAEIRTALTYNPTVKQRTASYRAALKRIPQAGSLPDPEADLDFFLSPMELPSGRQVADLQLMQMFPWFGVLRLAKDEMSLMAMAAYESVREARLDVAFDIRSKRLEMQRNRYQAGLLAEQEEQLQRLMRLSRTTWQSGATARATAPTRRPEATAQANRPSPGGMSGMTGNAAGNGASPEPSGRGSMDAGGMSGSVGGMAGAPGDGLSSLYDLEAERAALQSERATLDDRLELLVAQYNVLLGRDVHAAVALPDSLPPALPELRRMDPLPDGPALDSLLEGNPMLRMLDLEQRSLEARREMNRRMAYPMVGVGLRYSILSKSPTSSSMMNGQDMLMPMVTLTLPIWRRKNAARVAETEELAAASGWNAASVRIELADRWRTARLDWMDAVRTYTLGRMESDLADRSYRLALQQLSTSNMALADLVSLVRRILDVRQKLADARFDAAQALLTMERLTDRSPFSDGTDPEFTNQPRTQ